MIHHTCKTLLHTYSVIPLILTAFLRRHWKCIIRRVHCTCSSWRFEAILPAAGCTRYCCRFLHGFYTHCRSVQPCYPSLSTYVFFTVVSWCVTFVARFWSTISSIWLAFCCSRLGLEVALSFWQDLTHISLVSTSCLSFGLHRGFCHVQSFFVFQRRSFQSTHSIRLEGPNVRDYSRCWFTIKWGLYISKL